MKTLVVYDSLHGNTKTIALAIGEAISGEVEVLHVDDADASGLGAYDLLVAGAPTHAFRPSPPMRDFLKRIPKGSLQGVKVAAFDTRATEEELHSHGLILSSLVSVFGYAAQPIGDKLESKGGEPVLPPEGFYVDGTEGPLAEGELERAADWARQIMAKVNVYDSVKIQWMNQKKEHPVKIIFTCHPSTVHRHLIIRSKTYASHTH